MCCRCCCCCCVRYCPNTNALFPRMHCVPPEPSREGEAGPKRSEKTVEIKAAFRTVLNLNC